VQQPRRSVACGNLAARRMQQPRRPAACSNLAAIAHPPALENEAASAREGLGPVSALGGGIGEEKEAREEMEKEMAAHV